MTRHGQQAQDWLVWVISAGSGCRACLQWSGTWPWDADGRSSGWKCERWMEEVLAMGRGLEDVCREGSLRDVIYSV